MLVEVSGGVTSTPPARWPAAGADLISVGALTHSAPALDLGLDLVDGARARTIDDEGARRATGPEEG